MSSEMSIVTWNNTFTSYIGIIGCNLPRSPNVPWQLAVENTGYRCRFFHSTLNCYSCYRVATELLQRLQSLKSLQGFTRARGLIEVQREWLRRGGARELLKECRSTWDPGFELSRRCSGPGRWDTDLDQAGWWVNGWVTGNLSRPCQAVSKGSLEVSPVGSLTHAGWSDDRSLGSSPSWC